MRKHPLRSGRYPALALLIFLSALGLLAASCSSRAPKGPAQPSVQMTPDALAGSAGEALAKKDYARAEMAYSKALEQPGLSPDLRLSALRGASIAASKSGHHHLALTYLRQWSQADPKAGETWEWQDLYVDSLVGTREDAAARTYLTKILSRPEVPAETRALAGFRLAGLYWDKKDPASSMKALAETYAGIPGAEDRKPMERRLREELGGLSDPELARLAGVVTAENQFQYPYAIAAFLKAERQARAGDSGWAQAWPVMRRILSRAELTDKAPLSQSLEALEKNRGVPEQGIVLALPLSGRFAPVGWKVLRGAGAAQWRMARAGSRLEVKVVNTDAPGWLAELAQVPPHFRVMGGPLQLESVREFIDSGAGRERVAFAFTPSLGEGEEGAKAWRFFASPVDQVRALVDFCVNHLGITGFATLYPDERFGSRMAQVFREEAGKRGGHVYREEHYPPQDHPKWGAAVARLLGVSPGKGAVAPNNPFKAVFLPDSLPQAEILVPYFFHYEESRMALLGPEMWNQAGPKAMEGEERYFELAVFPGAWWAESTGGRELSRVLSEDGMGAPDFWVALGYDFVRFASALGSFPAGWTPDMVNTRLAGGPRVDYALAPMVWDKAGQASEQLFLFTPEQGGPAPADPAQFQERMAKVEQRRAYRVKILRDQWEAKQKKSQGQTAGGARGAAPAEDTD
jgi:hypothetical protein